jgi:hypothetical protein
MSNLHQIHAGDLPSDGRELTDRELDAVAGGSFITEMAAAGLQGAASGVTPRFPIGPATGTGGGGGATTGGALTGMRRPRSAALAGAARAIAETVIRPSVRARIDMGVPPRVHRPFYLAMHTLCRSGSLRQA